MRSAVHGHQMFFEGSLPDHATVVLLVNARLTKQDSQWILRPHDASEVVPRPYMHVQGLKQVVELCSGMGCMGVGLQEAGFEICLRNGCNPNMLKLAQSISDCPVLLGDLTKDATLVQACHAAPMASVLASGISCQPYSRLGDQHAQHDPRSATLPGTLRFGFLGRFSVLLLECVQEAKDCSWVQTTLAQFSSHTGYKISQGELHLHAVWPARRSRWWCILSRPMLGSIPWSPFPVVKPLPLVAHVLDSFRTCNEKSHVRFVRVEQVREGRL